MKAGVNVICTVAAAAVGLATGAIGMWQCYEYNGIFWLIGYFIMFVAFYPLAVALHEGGHKLFGKFAKIEVKVGQINPFMTSSPCSIRPLASSSVRGRFIATAIGGVAVNALFAILGLAMFAGGDVCLLFTCFAPSSLYLAIINAVPVTYGGGKTDGLLVWEAANNTPDFQVLARVLQIQGMLSEGKKLSDIEEDLLFSVPQIQEDDAAFIMLVSLRADYYKARGDEEKSSLWSSRLEDLRQYLPEGWITDAEN